MKAFIQLTCFLLIFLWIYAAASKILDYETFVIQLGKSPLIGSYATWMATVIPAIEIVLAVLLLVPAWRTQGLYGSLILMTTFSLYLLYLLSLKENIPCSCGGILGKMSWDVHIAFNLLFVALIVVSISFQSLQPRQHTLKPAA